jgi:hypothetical protein
MNTQTKQDERTEERKNRFTGESIMLTPTEAIKHDRIFMNELAATLEDKELRRVHLNYGRKSEPTSIGSDNITLKLTWFC